ncbi:glycosyltransferase [Effusibacillus pohliae]|uniref:glycosyltransferase n=1 Tax=Effusibacillus pohliae TaxID=232270 RepID=UPI00037DCF98|nr:glycosyltransferase family 2 protein [Effusibacillus pohliae]
MLRSLLVISTFASLFGWTGKVLEYLMLVLNLYMMTVLVYSFYNRKISTKLAYKPKVSILIPAHNEQNVIAETVYSILDQTYQNIEIIVIDDASSVVSGIQTRVRMYNRNQNIWTMLQDSEFAIHCSIFQSGRDSMLGCCGLGGNGQFVKRDALESVGGWKTGRLAECICQPKIPPFAHLIFPHL